MTGDWHSYLLRHWRFVPVPAFRSDAQPLDPAALAVGELHRRAANVLKETRPTTVVRCRPVEDFHHQLAMLAATTSEQALMRPDEWLYLETSSTALRLVLEAHYIASTSRNIADVLSGVPLHKPHVYDSLLDFLANSFENQQPTELSCAAFRCLAVHCLGRAEVAQLLAPTGYLTPPSSTRAQLWVMNLSVLIGNLS